MKLWDQYSALIRVNFDVEHENLHDIIHWRNLLFANTIIYILPLSLIALIPAILFTVINQMWVILAADMIAVFLILLIGFSPKLTIQARRYCFVYCVYSIAIVILFTVGLAGPGFLFMYGAAIFCIIIFPNEFSYFPSLLNLFICLIFAAFIPLNIMPWADQDIHNLTEFALISSNLIFLSFLSSALLPKVFDGFHNSLKKEKEMRSRVDQQKRELENALAELKNKNKDLEMFAYTSSHDLQEPLRMITSFLTLLQKKYGEQLDEKANQYIYYAVDGAKRMRQVILDLLQFSRAVHMEGKKEPVDLNQLIDDICLLFRNMIDEKKAVIRKSNLPTLFTNRTAFQQIFQNLINNALKYSEKNKPPIIEIGALEEDNNWTFSVADNGIGIPEEHSDKIFVLFQRLHNREEYSGTGMGLAIVKKMVENLNGRIWFEQNENTGTTFFFKIPKHEIV